jgi:hypothetical protein
MLSFEEIAEEAKAYANLTDEQIENMATADLHNHLSMRLVAQEEVTSSKKDFSRAAGDLLKRMRGDVICLNREIRKRFEAEKEARRAAKAKARADGVEFIELLPEPDGLVVAG